MSRWSDNLDPPELPPMIEILPHSIRNVPTTVTLANSELRIDPNLFASNFFEDQSMSTNTGPPSFDSFLLPIPNDCVGLMIGKQGDMIKKLRQSSNANVIQVAKDCSPGCSYRNVFIEGSPESYNLAKKMIYEIIDENNKAKRLPTFNLTHTLQADPYMEVIIPNPYIPLLLGPDMETLQRIQVESSCNILVPVNSAPGTNNRHITVTGQPEGLRAAKRLIYEVLEPAYRQHAEANGIEFPVHELIDPEFPYSSFYALLLKQQMITMTSCEASASGMNYWSEYSAATNPNLQ